MPCHYIYTHGWQPHPHHPFRFRRPPPAAAAASSFSTHHNNPLLIYTFQACSCTYNFPTLTQCPLDPNRLVRTESIPQSHKSPPRSPHHHQHYHHNCSRHPNPHPQEKKMQTQTQTETQTETHIFSGHCRIHEYIQFIEVYKHIASEAAVRLSLPLPLSSEVNDRGKKMELEQRRRELVLKDVKGRVDGMVEKLRGRWALEGVGARLCFGDGDGGRLRGFGGFTFTEEEWEMHGVLLVREGRPVGDEGLWW